ncbi:MAG: hypothetical protein AAFY34_13750 [Pseudomonadota bacterium]
MMNRIMKTGVVAVALAASALLATPAVAQTEFAGGSFGQRGVSDARLQKVHHRGYGHQVRLNQFGQTPAEVKYLADRAIYECSCQLQIDARYVGYRGADLRRVRYEQVGRNRFVVYGRAKLFDGYDYRRQPYECVVRRGKIRRASDLYPVQHAGFHRDGYRRRGISFSYSGW